MFDYVLVHFGEVELSFFKNKEDLFIFFAKNEKCVSDFMVYDCNTGKVVDIEKTITFSLTVKV